MNIESKPREGPTNEEDLDLDEPINRFLKMKK
jgi:hypothetical protein